jgi:hypothetical protein
MWVRVVATTAVLGIGALCGFGIGAVPAAATTSKAPHTRPAARHQLTAQAVFAAVRAKGVVPCVAPGDQYGAPVGAYAGTTAYLNNHPEDIGNGETSCYTDGQPNSALEVNTSYTTRLANGLMNLSETGAWVAGWQSTTVTVLLSSGTPPQTARPTAQALKSLRLQQRFGPDLTKFPVPNNPTPSTTPSPSTTSPPTTSPPITSPSTGAVALSDITLAALGGTCPSGSSLINGYCVPPAYLLAPGQGCPSGTDTQNGFSASVCEDTTHQYLLQPVSG